MPIEVLTRVDRDLSVDPSYTVRYQVFEDGHFLGDGVAQYHRLAVHNDIAVPGTIRRKDGKPLSEEERAKITRSIDEAARSFYNSR